MAVGDEVAVAEDDDGEGVTFWILLFESFAFVEDDELDEEEEDVEEFDDEDDNDDDEDEDADAVTLAKEAADLLA